MTGGETISKRRSGRIRIRKGQYGSAVLEEEIAYITDDNSKTWREWRPVEVVEWDTPQREPAE